MTGAEFCALTDAEKRAHVATLSDHQRRKLIDAVADYHKAKGEAADPFRLRLNQQFREWAAKCAHVSKLSAPERNALVNAVAHHAARAKPSMTSKPTGKSASQQQAQTWQKFAEKIWRTLKEKPQK